ncbi:hypothetical protein N7532_007683 [Penicillium argentinense]|uniref:Uncharacterized protein n=1 Tax=Penicillium argentinense TaxID=1131581 RepID=A0A9W9EW47_9EURO|nr:uncharacterized protein N7532_007683 [Penicillium argentinense]KAJ5088999.1 hypothetical protein N7532_007683 [Penicillium argentinense]
MTDELPIGPKRASNPDKPMSSRLMTMKFMQRAAATAAEKEPQTPGSDENVPKAKRPRLSTEASSPGTPQSELDAISAALKAEEDKRRDIVTRQAAEAGDSEWVLEDPFVNAYPTQPNVVAADSLDAPDDAPVGGRRSFGNFKGKKTVEQTSASQSKDDDDDDDDDEDELVNPANSEQVMEIMERKRAKMLEKATRQAKQERKRNPDNIKHLTSISGGRPQPKDMPSKKKNKKKRKSES